MQKNIIVIWNTVRYTKSGLGGASRQQIDHDSAIYI